MGRRRGGEEITAFQVRPTIATTTQEALGLPQPWKQLSTLKECMSCFAMTERLWEESKKMKKELEYKAGGEKIVTTFLINDNIHSFNLLSLR